MSVYPELFHFLCKAFVLHERLNLFHLLLNLRSLHLLRQGIHLRFDLTIQPYSVSARIFCARLRPCGMTIMLPLDLRHPPGLADLETLVGAVDTPVSEVASVFARLFAWVWANLSIPGLLHRSLPLVDSKLRRGCDALCGYI